MIDFEKALQDPSDVFKRPNDVLQHDALSREQKIKILTSWAHDEMELSIAEEENMPNRAHETISKLDEILRALLSLGVTYDPHAH